MERTYLTTGLVGGLGNQLFLVSNLLATARRNGITAVMPLHPFSSSNEEPRPVYWSSIFKNLSQFGVLDRMEEHALKEILLLENRPAAPITVPRSKGILFNMIGFFQSEHFFSDFPIIKDAIPKDLQESAKKHLYINYKLENEHCVAMHVRRGDYTRMKDVFAILDEGYYDTALRQLLGSMLLKESVRKFSQQLPQIHVLVFSEDVDFGSTLVGYFRSKYAGLQVDLVHPDNEKVSLECGKNIPREVAELLMMTHCNDLIMANSTFSWWGAYLNSTPLRRVIAPVNWFVKDPYPASNHLYCDNWILI